MKAYKIYFKCVFSFGKGKDAARVGRMYDVTSISESEQEAEEKFWRDIRLGSECKVERNPLVGGVHILRIEEVTEL